MKNAIASVHRKRILDAVNHRKPDRLPTDMWATKEVQEKLLQHFNITAGLGQSSPYIGLCGGPLSRGIEGIIALWDRMDIDGIFDVHPPYIGPALEKQGSTFFNEWGFGYQKKPYELGTYDEQVVFPLEAFDSIDALEDYRWPDPDWYDYDQLPQLIEQCQGRAVCCGYSALFTYHNYLRGMEKSLMDPLMDPHMCRYILDKVSDFFHTYHSRCFEAAGQMIDFTQVTDDWGSQTGLMTSPTVFNEFYRKGTERAIELAKKHGIHVFHHDDGDMRALLPTMVELGIEILNPIQWRCGDWDLSWLKQEFGSAVCFHSAVDNQETLPMGTPQEVRDQVKHLIQTLFADGTGFILGPCHNLQPNTSVENILAMYEAAHEFGSRV